MVYLVQTQLLGHALDGACQLLAERLWSATEGGGDLGPVAPLLAQLQQPALLLGEQAISLVEQLAGGEPPAGGGVRGDEVVLLGVHALGPAMVAPAGPLIAAQGGAD